MMSFASDGDAQDGDGDWSSLPLHPLACVVEKLAHLPRHQYLRTLAACRLLNAHWRAAVDGAVQRWEFLGTCPVVRSSRVPPELVAPVEPTVNASAGHPALLASAEERSSSPLRPHRRRLGCPGSMPAPQPPCPAQLPACIPPPLPPACPAAPHQPFLRPGWRHSPRALTRPLGGMHRPHVAAPLTVPRTGASAALLGAAPSATLLAPRAVVKVRAGHCGRSRDCHCRRAQLGKPCRRPSSALHR